MTPLAGKGRSRMRYSVSASGFRLARRLSYLLFLFFFLALVSCGRASLVTRWQADSDQSPVKSLAPGTKSNPSCPSGFEKEEILKLLKSLVLPVDLRTDFDRLYWDEPRSGDWTNDGIVSAADLSPLASHFGESSNPLSPNFWMYAAYLDYNQDGLVSATDLSPVGFDFGRSIGGFNIYQAADSSGASQTFETRISRPTPSPDNGNPPWNVSFSTLVYDTKLGTLVPPGFAPIQGKYYKVIAHDRADPPIELPGISSSWVLYDFPPNQLPTAILTSDVSSGNAPLTVNFDATGSNDPDGTITEYAFDFEGDGTYDVSGASPTAQYTYSSAGTYTATLRVTDNRGGQAQDTLVITVAPPNQPPVAVMSATPTSGRAPLFVQFDATQSNDPDGSIILYRFEDDKGWLVENMTGVTSNNYTQRGVYQVTLTVTDDRGAQSSSTKTILVYDWLIETVDSAGDVGKYSSITFIPPAGWGISYFSETPGILKFARRDAVWAPTIVDASGTVGGYTSIAYSGSEIGISYRYFTNLALKYASFDGLTWNTDTVLDDPTDDIGNYTSLEFSPSGDPFIAHYDLTHGDLLLSERMDSIWSTQIMSQAGDVGSYASLAFDDQGGPIFAHYEAFTRELKFTFFDTTQGVFTTETVDTIGDAGKYASLAVSQAGRVPAISYVNSDTGELRFAKKDPGWIIITVESGVLTQYTSLAFDANGDPMIAYYNDLVGGELRFATWNGAQWVVEVVDTAGQVGQYVSLSASPEGIPGISYYDATNRDLKFATWTTVP